VTDNHQERSARPRGRQQSLLAAHHFRRQVPSVSFANKWQIVVGRGLLEYLFPQDATYFNAQAQEAASSRVWGGIYLPVGIETGLQLGNEVATLVVKRAKR
jgi:hypothetical protein